MLFDKRNAKFYILEILKEFSDKDHLLTQQDIMDKLHDIYQVDMERKTVSSNLYLLQDLDYDVVIEKKGCYLGEREFDETEVKYLIDAIYSSKVISSENASSISKKLYSFLSKYQRNDYNYVYKTKELTRTNNKEFFYNISIITEAIKEKKKIEFIYLSYDKQGNLVDKKPGYKYIVSPYFLVNNFGNYYLLANISKYDNHSNFRLDFMKNISITDEKIIPYENIKSMGPNFDIAKHMNDHVYMFGGEIINAKVLVKEEYAITYLYDWFGKNVKLEIIDGKLYANIRTDDRAFVYWALQFSHLFTVISPDSIRNKIIDILKESLEDYKKNA